MDELSEATGLNARSLDWHIKLLEVGLCVERRQWKDGVEFQLTREGLVVDYMDK